MSRLRALLKKARLGEAPTLMILAGLVGVGAGLGAVALITAIELVSSGAEWVSESLHLGSFWPLLILPVGMWLSWRLTSRFAPEVVGHGVPQIVAAIAVRGGRIRPRVMGMKTVATALTIGSGGSAGREGSIAQIGASIGSWAARKARLSENEVRTLVAAGAGAGISATFNAPIAGLFFALEVILQEFAVRHVHTIVIASVSAAVVSRSVIGEGLTFSVEQYFLDPPQLILFALLGLAAVLFAWLFLEALDRLETMPDRWPDWMRPVLFAVCVGLIGLIRPEVLGTGQDFVSSLLRDEAGLTWWVLGLLAVLKVGATATTLGGRGAGGIFMPSLFIGAAAGSSIALLFGRVWGWSEIQPGAFALVGMAATFSAVARAPLTSILIVFEITGDYGLVLPLMIATAISTILAGRVRPESAYTAPLARMGIHPVHAGVTDLLDMVRVGEVIESGSVTIEPSATLGHVEGVLQRNRLHGAPVIDDGRLVGLIAESDILRAGGPSDQVTAEEAMTPSPITVNPDTRVSDALERMAALGVGRLPVVDASDPEQLIGMFRRADVVAAYHLALSTTARAHSVPERVQTRTGRQSSFFELTVMQGSVADGRLVSEVSWPEGCLVVSINRGAEQLVPSGATKLMAGDAITAFGTSDARDRLVERLAVRSDSPTA